MKETDEIMKIFDCFTFFDELDLLEIRLNILKDVVDYFVIVEAAFTHSGIKKEFVFEKNRSRVDDFKEKIIYVKVDDFPTGEAVKRSGLSLSWVYENFQRNAIERGLKNAQSTDVIMVSDVDEIPDPVMIEKCSRG